MLSFVYLGYTIVPLNPNMSNQNIARCLLDTKTDLIVTDIHLLSKVKSIIINEFNKKGFYISQILCLGMN